MAQEKCLHNILRKFSKKIITSEIQHAALRDKHQTLCIQRGEDEWKLDTDFERKLKSVICDTVNRKSSRN